ncbi:hypothetical protein O3P69_020599 [Scylla paramamosain]|uniref:Uncharacterized protein n=1 Tax=Scylla paramamosain TaxID=85552 RepID=A0AAW0TLX1_SCYPA
MLNDPDRNSIDSVYYGNRAIGDNSAMLAATMSNNIIPPILETLKTLELLKKQKIKRESYPAAGDSSSSNKFLHGNRCSDTEKIRHMNRVRITWLTIDLEVFKFLNEEIVPCSTPELPKLFEDADDMTEEDVEMIRNVINPPASRSSLSATAARYKTEFGKLSKKNGINFNDEEDLEQETTDGDAAVNVAMCNCCGNASRVLEQYLLESTNAIVNVARNVKSLSGVITPQDEEVASAIMFGTPKTSAKDVASLVNYRRKRVEQNMSKIFGYINRLPVPSKVSVYKRSGYGCGLSGGGASHNKMRDHNTMNIGLTMASGTVLDKEKYVSAPKVTVAQTTGPECELDEETVVTTLLHMFSLLNIENDDFDSLI